MVPDDYVKAPHLSIALELLTPQRRPVELTDDLWDLIEECADLNPDLDAVEILECITRGDCGCAQNGLVSLAMILFVFSQDANAEPSR